MEEGCRERNGGGREEMELGGEEWKWSRAKIRGMGNRWEETSRERKGEGGCWRYWRVVRFEEREGCSARLRGREDRGDQRDEEERKSEL